MNKLRIFILTIGLVIAQNSMAQGIPVIDTASIARLISEGAARVAEFKQNYEEAKNRLQALKDHQQLFDDMVSGHYNYKDIINDPNINDFMASTDWGEIFTAVDDLDDLREEFSMVSDNADVQALYDNQLREYKLRNDAYNSSVTRNTKMEALLSEFAAATTPAAKQDIANAISYEQTQIHNDAEMLKVLGELSAQKASLIHQARGREIREKLFGDGFTRRKAPAQEVEDNGA